MKVTNNIYYYFKSNKMIFIMVILVFFIGIILGGYSSSALAGEEVTDIKRYTDKFFSAMILQSTDKNAVFLTKFVDYFKFSTIIWISGFFAFLIPVSLIQIFFKGFRSGFMIAYFSGVYKISGVAYSLLNCFLENLLFLPLIVFFTVHCIKNSVKNNNRIKKSMFSIGNLVAYGACIFAALILSLFDGYVMTSVIKILSSLNI